MDVIRCGLRTVLAFAAAGVLVLLLAALLLPATALAVPSGSGTCGKTTIGKVADRLIANQKRVNRCTLPVNATIRELVFYVAPTSQSGEQVLKGIFYADSKGKPGNRLGETGKFKFSSKEAAGWHHFLFLTPLKLSAGTYWMGVISGATTKVAGERYDKVANAEDYNSNSYLSGPTDPFGPFKTTSEEMSLYAPYNAEVPRGSCDPSSSLAALIFGKDVTAYVPKGFWGAEATQAGVSVVNVEGSAITTTKIPTKSPVNSCASNSLTGVTVCTANTNEVYVLKETKIEHELTSGASGTIHFSGGSCTNCGVAMDSAHNRALIALSVAGKPGFQFLNLETLKFEAPFEASSGGISEDPLVDPTRELILSPTESNFYEIVNVTKPSEPSFFVNGPIAAALPGKFDSAGADCSTGIALSTIEFQNSLYLTDLTQAKFTLGKPAGTWTAPEQVQPLEETKLEAGSSGIAVAQGTHTGTVTGEFGGNEITAIALPETSGSGTPVLRDYVTCSLEKEWFQGFDPHVVTAYQSPNGGDAIALFGNGKENPSPPFEEGPTKLARVDLTKMLNTSIVKRTAGGHACEAATLPESVESFISVP